MRRISSQLVQTILILLVSMSAAVLITWLAPSLSAATINMLFRLRGKMQPPGDIVIVAIDDASLQEVGNWPWPRSVMKSALDRISGARPRAVGLDVIYAESSDAADDAMLAEAMRRNGRVVLPAQLVDAEAANSALTGSTIWLMPLPEIRDGAAAVGHAHADPDVDGVLRTIQLSKADARGDRLWSFGLETLRVAEGLPPAAIEEQANSLRFGRYEIAIHDEAEKASLPGLQIIRPNEMLINYLGPPRTFPYYSIADVLHERVPASTFNDKIVLIGAVAQTMGDTRITPFISYGADEAQSGTGMPGVEVHANVIETIRRGAWLRPLPDWLSFAVALVVILSAALIIKLLDGWREIAGLSGLFGLIVVGSLYVFDRHFIIPPVVPMLAGLFSVVPLLLLDKSMMASRDLDQKLETLAGIQNGFMSHKIPEDSFDAPLSFLGPILRAESIALFEKSSTGQPLRLAAYFGLKPAEGEAQHEADAMANGEDGSSSSLRLPLKDETELLGALVIKRRAGEPFSDAERKLAHEFADGLARELRAALKQARFQKRSLPISLPRNIIWKLRAVDHITSRLVARIGFMNRVFTSMTEGLLIADITGQVVFANQAAQRFCEGSTRDALTGMSLTELFVKQGIIELARLRETMRAVLAGQTVQVEVERLIGEGRFYTIQFSAVIASDATAKQTGAQADEPFAVAEESPRIIGLIIIINDVTKRRELERIKAETLQLVSHELRTPLTSIQGLSDLLLKFPVSEAEAQEILGTIHSEAVRLNELINRYLDVTRIESGAQPLARKVIAANQLITGCVRSLGGLAAEKGIRFKQRLEEPSPTLFGDAQLLAQAVNNLLSNAVKYGPPRSSVEVGSASVDGNVRIYVRDEGEGIPPEAQEQIFEKFYRLQRDENSGIIGTGLGLPLVKEIVERHGGHVTVESRPGAGSTFTLHLPHQAH